MKGIFETSQQKFCISLELTEENCMRLGELPFSIIYFIFSFIYLYGIYGDQPLYLQHLENKMVDVLWFEETKAERKFIRLVHEIEIFLFCCLSDLRWGFEFHATHCHCSEKGKKSCVQWLPGTKQTFFS